MITLDTHVFVWWLNEPKKLGVQFHGDPANMLIVATAELEGAPLVTEDQRILEYDGVETIWD